MSAYKLLPHYPYDDWVNWEGKWELIEGIPYAMSPSPVPKHQRVANEIATEFTLALRNKNCKHCRVYNPVDYKIADDTILEPDILIICGNVSKKYLDFPPSLVVEILSPSTALKDRNTKYQLYQQETVKYYLIVDTEKEEIEVYTLIDKVYQLISSFHTATIDFTFEDDCSATVNFENVWS